MFNPIRPVSGFVKLIFVVGFLLVCVVLFAGVLSLKQFLGVLF